MSAKNPLGERAIPGRTIEKKEQATLGSRKVFVNELVGADDVTDFSVHEFEVSLGGEIPLHIHERHQETLYVISGHAKCEVGGKVYEGWPGSWHMGQLVRVWASRMRVTNPSRV